MTYHKINSIVAVSKNGWVTLGLVEARTEIQSRVGTRVTYDVWLLDDGAVTFTEECVTGFDVMTYAPQHALFAPLYNSLSKELEKRENQKYASETENS
jgi:hypothetical protein